MRKRWEERRRRQKELKYALMFVPLILFGWGGFIYGFILLMEYCGLL
jgi:hypothetical protein